MFKIGVKQYIVEIIAGLSSYLALLIYPLYISTRKGNSPLIRLVWNFNSSVTLFVMWMFL